MISVTILSMKILEALGLEKRNLPTFETKRNQQGVLVKMPTVVDGSVNRIYMGFYDRDGFDAGSIFP